MVNDFGLLKMSLVVKIYSLRSVLERVWSEVGDTVRSRYRTQVENQTNVTNVSSPAHMKEGRDITFSENMRLER